MAVLLGKTTLLGERIYNITAKDSLVLAASQSGLWKSFDGQKLGSLRSCSRHNIHVTSQILTDVVYTSALDERNSVPNLWIGTSNGAAISLIFMVQAGLFSKLNMIPLIYVYPNPFSPFNHNQLGGEGYVRFHTGNIANTQIELDIYNFAMEKVYQHSYDLNIYNGAMKWNGRDMNGSLVDNGVYFHTNEICSFYQQKSSILLG